VGWIVGWRSAVSARPQNSAPTPQNSRATLECGGAATALITIPRMIALFLQSAAHAAYQVVQATPQVVPVCPPQAPLVLPPLRIAEMPPGMPEWEKILITAGTGAVLGIASSLASERFRRRDAEKELIETISTQLAAELLDNLDKVDQAKAKLAQDMGSPSMSLAAALFFLDNIQNDRFEFYYKTEKTTYYKIDDEKFLYQFYEEIKKSFASIRRTRIWYERSKYSRYRFIPRR